MKRNIGDDRRSDDRRNSDEKSDSKIPSSQRKAQRRARKRREYIRLTYPHTGAPKVLNANYTIIDISKKGISFVCRDDCDECKHPISLNSTIDLKIQFHDGEIADIKVEIRRCERALHSKDRTYAGDVKKGITRKRIAKEQAYLMNNFPAYLCTSSVQVNY